MALITDLPQIEEQFRRTFLSQSVQSITMAHTNTWDARPHFYLATASDFSEENYFRSDYVLLSSGEPISAVDKQFSFIAMSQAMFKNAKPLDGKELDMLNQSYSMHFSKTPTRL